MRTVPDLSREKWTQPLLGSVWLLTESSRAQVKEESGGSWSAAPASGMQAMKGISSHDIYIVHMTDLVNFCDMRSVV